MAYPRVSMLPSGFLTLPEHFFCADQTDHSIRNTVPSMSFLIRHASHNIVFDLGMRKILDNYPTSIRPHLATRQPITTAPDTSDSLRSGGLEPSNVDIVVLSHVHYDHVGTPSDFDKALFVVGYGVRHLLQHGMKYHSAAKFEKDLLPEDRIVELPIQTRLPDYAQPVQNEMPPSARQINDIQPEGSNNRQWQRLGPLNNAIDLFGDGRIYVVDSPGHLVGHLNLLVCTSPGHWVYLAGDACHHARLLDGETEFARWEENGIHVCIHQDEAVAKDTLSRIQMLRSKGLDGSGGDTVEVIFAHDAQWSQRHPEAIFPGHLG